MRAELLGSEPGLCAYFKFNEGIGCIVHDTVSVYRKAKAAQEGRGQDVDLVVGLAYHHSARWVDSDLVLQVPHVVLVVVFPLPRKYYNGCTPQERGGVTPPPPGTPPPQTKGTISGKNEIYRWENLIGPFLDTHFWVPTPPPPPPLSSNTSLPPPPPTLF